MFEIVRTGMPNEKSYRMDILIDGLVDLELDTFPDCAPGSTAYTADYSIYLTKKTDGTWQGVA